MEVPSQSAQLARYLMFVFRRQQRILLTAAVGVLLGTLHYKLIRMQKIKRCTNTVAVVTRT